MRNVKDKLNNSERSTNFPHFAFCIGHFAFCIFFLCCAIIPPARGETPASNASNWPGFLGPHRNGKSDEHGLPTTWPPKGPPVVWQKPVGTGYSAPAISDG